MAETTLKGGRLAEGPATAIANFDGTLLVLEEEA
jgi:hypothetical protein